MENQNVHPSGAVVGALAGAGANAKAPDAVEIATAIGASFNFNDMALALRKPGVKAKVGQYSDMEHGRVDLAEKINAARGRYTAHQGKRELARRLRQVAAMRAVPTTGSEQMKKAA